MMRVILLGIVQGLTEFLPISSSGHLAILENYLGIREPVAISVVLHFGTFLATVLFFIKPLWLIVGGLFRGEKRAFRYLINIVVGTVPAVIFALAFRRAIESSFTNMKFVALSLGMTGVILLLTVIVKKGEQEVNLIRAFLIGISQMLALFPGVSRSGLTIATGIFSGVNIDESFRFSFLLSLPAVLGANILQFKQVTMTLDWSVVIVGLSVSLGFGLLALKIFQITVRRNLPLFGYYCLALGLLFLLIQREY